MQQKENTTQNKRARHKNPSDKHQAAKLSATEQLENEESSTKDGD